MRQESEKMFDPLLLASFIRCLPEMHAIAEQYPDRNRANSFSGVPNCPIPLDPTDLAARLLSPTVSTG